MGELAMPFVCPLVTWARERYLFTPSHLWQAAGELALRSSEQKSWPCPSPAVAFRRAGPVPCMSSTGELALDVGVAGHEHRTACPASCPLIGGENEKKTSSSPLSSLAINGRLENWPRPSPAGLVPLLCRRIEHPLVAALLISHPKA